MTHFDTLGWHWQPGPSLSARQRHFLWGFQAVRVGIEQRSAQEKAGKGSPQSFSSRMQQPSALAQRYTQNNGSSLATANDSTKECKACSPFWCHKQGKQKKYSTQGLKTTRRNVPGSSQEPRQAFLFSESRVSRDSKVLQNSLNQKRKHYVK